MKSSTKILYKWQVLLYVVGTIAIAEGYEYIYHCLGTILVYIFILKLYIYIHEDYNSIYPPNKKRRPFVLKKMFKWLFNENLISLNIIIGEYIWFLLTVLVIIVYVILGVMKKEGYLELMVVHCCIGILLFLYVYYGFYLTVYFERFKCLNRYNIHYIWFITYKKTCKWPNSELLGKCTVIHLVKKGKKKFAEVRMKDNGTTYKDVFVSEELDAKINGTYKLHEICHVKFII